MFNWKRMFTDFGWTMAMTDPTCYSYYLASRLDNPNGKGAPNIALPRTALSRRQGSCATDGTSEHQRRKLTAYSGHAVTRQDALRHKRVSSPNT